MARLSPLIPYLQRQPRKLVSGLVAVLLAAVFGLASPILVGSAVDAFRGGVTTATLAFYAGVLLLVTLVQGFFNYSQRMTLVALSRDVEYELRNDYFTHLERLPQSFYQLHTTGDLMARATNDLQAVRMLCGPAIMYGSNTVFTATGALVLMLRLDLRLTLLALATAPLVAIATKVCGDRIYEKFEAVQERFAEVSTRAQENLAGVRVVRAYAREEAEKERFAGLNRAYVESNRSLARWSAAFHPLLQALVGVGFVVVLWYGGLAILDGRLSIGQFVTFNLFLGKLVWPMIAVGWVMNLVQRGSASLARIQEVLATPPAIADRPDAEPLAAPLAGAVACRRLTFTYPGAGQPALADLDLEVPAGATVAVVGRTGSGKSTLLSLLPRLLEPPPDSLLFDGRDVTRLRLADLRSQLAMVPQETFLFSATMAQNIAFGDPGASREEIAEAARLAGLEEDLEVLPRGLDTVVGERGITLSGGQKQRVALARAVLRKPRLLLLDDCLSAVDTHTEERILANLRAVFTGRTVFLVSHRISTVQDADLIVVLDRGRIVERGDHTSLLAHGGIYAELNQRQLLEEQLATAV